LQKTPDILQAVAALDPKPFVVAFAAETDNVEAYAREKLERKQLDFIVANDVSRADSGFDSDQNEVLIIGRGGEARKIGRAPKSVIADRILDAVVQALAV
jgi:phosphopantothenoylcysteine decarboxylase/phosphopantothenate--cysteine ligase